MSITVTESTSDILPLRTRHRAEMNGQIVHDSIHRREGWTETYLISQDGCVVGFGSVATGGPWREKPAIFEFYVLPEFRSRAFAFFEAFLLASDARHFEVQTSDILLTVMLHTFGREIASEKIVFADGLTTHHPSHGTLLRCITPENEIRAAVERRQGGGEWILELDGATVASGGILFHYNRPYGDVYMEVDEPFRRQGLGSYLVQELKSACYEFGAIPCARCNPGNIGSRKTLQKAGFIPYAHILIATTGSV